MNNKTDLTPKDKQKDGHNHEELVNQLFNVGAHLGHRKSRLHPKAKKYIHSIISGQTIINLEKTADQIVTAKNFLTQLGIKGKSILVVATKKIYSQAIKNLCQDFKINYLTNKWPAGFLTNFETIIEHLKRFEKIKGELSQSNNLVKHEKVKIKKQLNRIERVYQGVQGLKSLPDALIIADVKKEKNAFIEAKKKQIPVIGICDTNTNPDLVDFPIVANDDLESSVVFILKYLLEAYYVSSQK